MQNEIILQLIAYCQPRIDLDNRMPSILGLRWLSIEDGEAEINEYRAFVINHELCISHMKEVPVHLIQLAHELIEKSKQGFD